VSKKEESVIPIDKYPAKYRAVLHTENNTGQEIYLFVDLGDYTTGANQESDNPNHVLGSNVQADGMQVIVPLGASDIIINVRIFERNGWFCKNGTLTKPLHLLYRISIERYNFSDPINGSLPVNKSINQRLQELACGAAP
jgi:hypothetical protein